MQQIENRIYIETIYPGVTIGALLLKKGTVLIDTPPHPDDSRSWVNMLRSMGGEINTLLVNLDSHYDRTLGARALECPVLVHQETDETLTNRANIFKGQTAGSGSDWEITDGLAGLRWAKPTIVYTDEITLHWDEFPVVISYHPGPASGASWIELPESNLVFVGDAVVHRQPPFLADANIPLWIETLDLLLSAQYRNYLVISSRGGIVDTTVIREQRSFLKEVLKRLTRLNERNSPPEATESLVPNFLSHLDFPPDRHEHYTQRLKYGLYHYYSKHFLNQEDWDNLQEEE